jgi:hypothetical protein
MKVTRSITKLLDLIICLEMYYNAKAVGSTFAPVPLGKFTVLHQTPSTAGLGAGVNGHSLSRASAAKSHKLYAYEIGNRKTFIFNEK